MLDKTTVSTFRKTKHNQWALMSKGDKGLQKQLENQFFVISADDIQTGQQSPIIFFSFSGRV